MSAFWWSTSGFRGSLEKAFVSGPLFSGGVFGTLLLFGVGSSCGADPPYPESGFNLCEAAVVAAGGGVMADVAVVAAGAVVEDDDGPGAGVGAVGAIVAAGFSGTCLW